MTCTLEQLKAAGLAFDLESDMNVKYGQELVVDAANKILCEKLEYVEVDAREIHEIYDSIREGNGSLNDHFRLRTKAIKIPEPKKVEVTEKDLDNLMPHADLTDISAAYFVQRLKQRLFGGKE